MARGGVRGGAAGRRRAARSAGDEHRMPMAYFRSRLGAPPPGGPSAPRPTSPSATPMPRRSTWPGDTAGPWNGSRAPATSTTSWRRPSSPRGCSRWRGGSEPRGRVRPRRRRSTCDPACMSTPTAPGWYQDPEDPDQLRYFDGIVWSSHTTPRATPTPPVRTEPDGGVPAGWGPPPGSGGQQGWGAQQPDGGSSRTASSRAGASSPAGDSSSRTPGPRRRSVTRPGWGTARGGVLPDGAVLAEWWRRLVARILDWIVVGLVAALFTVGLLSDLVARGRHVLAGSPRGGRERHHPGHDPVRERAVRRGPADHAHRRCRHGRLRGALPRLARGHAGQDGARHRGPPGRGGRRHLTRRGAAATGHLRRHQPPVPGAVRRPARQRCWPCSTPPGCSGTRAARRCTTRWPTPSS